MLDHLLEVTYSREKTAQEEAGLVQTLRKLPNEELRKIATGQTKLGFGCDSDEKWLEKYKGTPLLGQAIALEQQALQVEMARQEQDAQQDEMRQQNNFWRQADQVRVQKRLLDLQLVQSQAAPPGAEAPPGAVPAPSEQPMMQATEEGPKMASPLWMHLGKTASKKKLSAAEAWALMNKEALSPGIAGGVWDAAKATAKNLDTGKVWNTVKGVAPGAGIGAGAGAVLGGVGGALSADTDKGESRFGRALGGAALGAAGGAAGGALAQGGAQFADRVGKLRTQAKNLGGQMGMGDAIGHAAHQSLLSHGTKNVDKAFDAAQVARYRAGGRVMPATLESSLPPEMRKGITTTQETFDKIIGKQNAPAAPGGAAPTVDMPTARSTVPGTPRPAALEPSGTPTVAGAPSPVALQPAGDAARSAKVDAIVNAPDAQLPATTRRSASETVAQRAARPAEPVTRVEGRPRTGPVTRVEGVSPGPIPLVQKADATTAVRAPAPQGPLPRFRGSADSLPSFAMPTQTGVTAAGGPLPAIAGAPRRANPTMPITKSQIMEITPATAVRAAAPQGPLPRFRGGADSLPAFPMPTQTGVTAAGGPLPTIGGPRRANPTMPITKSQIMEITPATPGRAQANYYGGMSQMPLQASV